ncbi:MAG: hypothetical protein Q4G07_11625 [Oscillospiraceae bacterium]|nr:hypothetical protein [Oscillospiraceae bacterium]
MGDGDTGDFVPPVFCAEARAFCFWPGDGIRGRPGKTKNQLDSPTEVLYFS